MEEREQDSEQKKPDQDRVRDVLLEEYKEVCKSHAGITDFQAKLLALLPIVSGTGIGLLATQIGKDLPKIGAGLLVALGIFGAVVTVGLFFYEVRQIDVCKHLRDHGAWIEGQLGIQGGQFGGRPPRLSLKDVYYLPLRENAEDPHQTAVTGLRNDAGDKPERGLLRRRFIGGRLPAI